LDAVLCEDSSVVGGDGTFEHLVKERGAIGRSDDSGENLTNKDLGELLGSQRDVEELVDRSSKGLVN